MIEFPHGFLDDNVYLMILNFRKKHLEQYKIVFLIAELINLIMADEDCKKFSNDREKYIICTVYDCYTTYSSEILLLERGLVSDFHVLLRTFYEKKFKLFSVIRNKKYYNKLIDEHEYYTTLLAKQVLDNKNHRFDDIVENIKKEEFDFKNYEKKKMSVESWANNGSLRSEYDTQYSLLSQATHYGIGSLTNKMENSGDNIVTYSSFSYNNFDENLAIASMEMLVCIDKFI